MKKQTIYLAYGSNLNLPQMARRCPTAQMLGPTELKGFELKFRGLENNAFATVEPVEDRSQYESAVPALLWRLRPNDEAALDIYEGLPRHYRKESVEVELNGKPVQAMVYIMNDGRELGMPSPMYFQTILEGYDAAGFDDTVLFAALDLSEAALEAKHGQEPTLGEEW